MRVSGFSFVRDAVHLRYPVVEAIRSVLPICDEFIVAVGDSGDGTVDLLRTIDSHKLQIVQTVWDPALFLDGRIFAQQTNVALQRCSGDWAFYVQADEVVHECDLPIIEERMRRYRHDARVEGLLFDYLHFFGDYDHVQVSHNWYAQEVRIVRPGIGVQSWHDAQGFRRSGEKLRVAHSGGTMYHYGWVRPPRHLHRKSRSFKAAYGGIEAAAQLQVDEEAPYRYGRLWGRRRYLGTHPAVMHAGIRQQDWQVYRTAKAHKHDRIGIQVLSFIENWLLGFRVGAKRNYIALSDIARHELALRWRDRITRHPRRPDTVATENIAE